MKDRHCVPLKYPVVWDHALRATATAWCRFLKKGTLKVCVSSWTCVAATCERAWISGPKNEGVSVERRQSSLFLFFLPAGPLCQSMGAGWSGYLWSGVSQSTGMLPLSRDHPPPHLTLTHLRLVLALCPLTSITIHPEWIKCLKANRTKF